MHMLRTRRRRNCDASLDPAGFGIGANGVPAESFRANPRITDTGEAVLLDVIPATPETLCEEVLRSFLANRTLSAVPVMRDSVVVGQVSRERIIALRDRTASRLFERLPVSCLLGGGILCCQPVPPPALHRSFDRNFTRA